MSMTKRRIDMPARKTKTPKMLPQDWEQFFRTANIRVEELDNRKSSRSRSIMIGQFLSPNVNREVPIAVNGRTGRAVLRVEEGRSKGKRYFIEVFWDDPSDTPEVASSNPAEAKGAQKPSAGEHAGPSTKPARSQNQQSKGNRASIDDACGSNVQPQGRRSAASAKGNDEVWG
jgi:hypothetical protein